jgi:6-phosphogluconolactonase
MITIYKDTEALSQAAAALFVKAAQESVDKNGRFTVALTGGSSPVRLYALLAQSPYREQVPWKQTYVFWGDERWVPLTDTRSNAKMAIDTLLQHVPVPEDQVYPMWGSGEPEEFAQQYEQVLQKHFHQQAPQFDLILLGMGDDGHTASLFPGTEVLQEPSRWVRAYYLTPQAMYRITLTALLINQARHIVFLTFGANKADALYEVQEGAPNPEKYPSQLIQPKPGEVQWLVDEAAAARLTKRR